VFFSPSFATWGKGQEENSGVGAPLCWVYGRSLLQHGVDAFSSLGLGLLSPGQGWWWHPSCQCSSTLLMQLCITHRRIRTSPQHVPRQGNGSKVLSGQGFIIGLRCRQSLGWQPIAD